MKKRVLLVLIALAMVFTLLPTVALAGGSAWVKEADGTEYYLNQGNQSGVGWDWNIETEVLTLNGFHGQSIGFGYWGKKIIIVDGSTNSLSEGLYLSPRSGGDGSVIVEGTGELIIDRITNETKTGVALEIDEYHGPVTIATPLQLTGGMKVGDNAFLTLEYVAWEGNSKATYEGYKGGTGYPVTADGDRAEYVRIGPADSATQDISTETSSKPSSTAFTDVPAGEWYADSVTWAVEKGITNGTSTSTFSPYQNCSHAQILTFLWRAAGEPKSFAAAPITLTGNEYYADAIRWAVEKSMIDKSFEPNADCARSNAVLYIWQAFDGPSAVASSFIDVPASASYSKAVSWAVAKEITKGTGETTFSPDKVCNRGEIVTFLYRAYN